MTQLPHAAPPRSQPKRWTRTLQSQRFNLAWTQLLALTGAARRWEPRRLRLRVFAVAGRLARGGRRLRLRLAERWPWASEITAAVRSSGPLALRRALRLGPGTSPPVMTFRAGRIGPARLNADIYDF